MTSLLVASRDPDLYAALSDHKDGVLVRSARADSRESRLRALLFSFYLPPLEGYNNKLPRMG
jgi:hypothetical protein